MPITIGGKPESSFADPMGLLTDCHRRIERFLSVLVQVSAQAHGGSLSSEQHAALETALRYFREMAPKHTADEEETLFPRLRSLDRPELKTLLEKISSLVSDHMRADRSHAEVDRLGQKWLASGSLAPADAERFSRLAGELAELYREHIGTEERELFPAAAAVLEKKQREAMGREMKARRGLSQV
jgi:hemerythrin-like domain-containing protein